MVTAPVVHVRTVAGHTPFRIRNQPNSLYARTPDGVNRGRLRVASTGLCRMVFDRTHSSSSVVHHGFGFTLFSVFNRTKVGTKFGVVWRVGYVTVADSTFACVTAVQTFHRFAVIVDLEGEVVTVGAPSVCHASPVR